MRTIPAKQNSSIKRAQDFGFENISIDLIYGSPTSNFRNLEEKFTQTIELEVPHVSSYALTIEPKTALNTWISQGKIAAPKEAEQHEEFFYMTDFLKDHEPDHYEISNFGKPGFHSKHNSSYWKYQEYLGIGPSVHIPITGEMKGVGMLRIINCTSILYIKIN